MKIDLATDVTTIDERVGTFQQRGNPLTGSAYVEVLGGGGGGGAGTSDTLETTQVLVKTAVQSIDTKTGVVTASPAAFTILGRLKDLLTGIILATGSNIIGKVGIDQTTPGTSNAVSIIGRITKTNKSGTITTGATAQVLMAANTSRIGWQLQNNSINDLWFNEIGGTAVTTQPSFKLTPGSVYESPVGSVTTAAISIIGSTTGQAFTAREW